MPPDSHAEAAAAAVPLQDVIQVEGKMHRQGRTGQCETDFCDNLHRSGILV